MTSIPSTENNTAPKPAFRIEKITSNYVLRRKPSGVLLPSAHAVDREFRVIGALSSTGTVPVPRALALCTDDRNPLDIAEEGHLDYMIRTAIANGADVLATYRIASHSAVRIFGLSDRGFIGPGKRADIVLVEDLATCSVKQVLTGGRLVEEALFADRATIAPVGLGSVKSRKLAPADFTVKARDGETPVIGVVPGRIITERLSMALPSRDGEALPEEARLEIGAAGEAAAPLRGGGLQPEGEALAVAALSEAKYRLTHAKLELAKFDIDMRVELDALLTQRSQEAADAGCRKATKKQSDRRIFPARLSPLHVPCNAVEQSVQTRPATTRPGHPPEGRNHNNSLIIQLVIVYSESVIRPGTIPA